MENIGRRSNQDKRHQPANDRTPEFDKYRRKYANGSKLEQQAHIPCSVRRIVSNIAPGVKQKSGKKKRIVRMKRILNIRCPCLATGSHVFCVTCPDRPSIVPAIWNSFHLSKRRLESPA